MILYIFLSISCLYSVWVSLETFPTQNWCDSGYGYGLTHRFLASNKCGRTVRQGSTRVCIWIFLGNFSNWFMHDFKVRQTLLSWIRRTLHYTAGRVEHCAKWVSSQPVDCLPEPLHKYIFFHIEKRMGSLPKQCSPNSGGKNILHVCF